MAAALWRQQQDAPACAVPQPVALLRLASLACRAGPRAPLDASLPAGAGVEARVRALAAFLPEALERRPVLWRPGAAGLSFDECWLAALLTALAADDRDSERFLTERRVRVQRRGTLRTLMLPLIAVLDIS